MTDFKEALKEGLAAAQTAEFARKQILEVLFAVGTPITQRPPHRSVRAELPHTAPTLGEWRRNADKDVHAKYGRVGTNYSQNGQTFPR